MYCYLLQHKIDYIFFLKFIVIPRSCSHPILNMHTRSQTNNTAPPSFVDVVFVVDRSGSMVSMGNGLVKGAQKFIETHSTLAGDSDSYNLRVVSFDHSPTQIYNGNATGFFKHPSHSSDLIEGLRPRGTTRLYDTILEEVEKQAIRVNGFKDTLSPTVKALDPRIVVILAVLTDGEDNVSIAKSLTVRNSIKKHIRDFDATCQFIAANLDANYVGKKMGFPVETCLQMDPDPQHAVAAMDSVAFSCVRTISGESPEFSQIERTSSARYVSQSWQPSFPNVAEDDDDDDDSQICRM